MIFVVSSFFVRMICVAKTLSGHVFDAMVCFGPVCVIPSAIEKYQAEYEY